jgi:hypothetical protein
MVYAPTDGLNIEAYIPAKDTNDSLALPAPEFDTITGTGYNGTPYTGVQAFISNSMTHFGVSQELHIHANEPVCGVRLASRSDRVFTSLMLGSPALTPWAIPSRIRRQNGNPVSGSHTRHRKIGGLTPGRDAQWNFCGAVKYERVKADIKEFTLNTRMVRSGSEAVDHTFDFET